MATQNAKLVASSNVSSNVAFRSDVKTAVKPMTTGINSAGIPKIQNSINEFITEIQKNILVSANVENAIKGSSSVASLKQMNKDITAELGRLMNTLKEYNTVLDSVLANYKSNDASNATFTNISKGLNKE